MHPGQPLEQLGLWAGAAPEGPGRGLGPAPLAVLAATALRSKLLEELRQLSERGREGAEVQEEGSRTSACGESVPVLEASTRLRVPTAVLVARTSAGRSSGNGGSFAASPPLPLQCSASQPHSRAVTATATATVTAGFEAGALAVKKVEMEEDEEDELQCGVCLSARVEVSPAGCRHGVCSACAVRMCGGTGVFQRPLNCPFCRRVVASFVKYDSLDWASPGERLA